MMSTVNIFVSKLIWESFLCSLSFCAPVVANVEGWTIIHNMKMWHTPGPVVRKLRAAYFLSERFAQAHLYFSITYDCFKLRMT